MMPSGYCIAIAIIIFLDCVDHAVADTERWFNPGDNFTMRCGMRSGKPCIENDRDILKYFLKDNTNENEQWINETLIIRCENESVVELTLPNITARATGIYDCVKPSLPKSVNVLVVDPLTKPENISCVFHGKKTLNCTYSFYDSVGYNRYSCNAIERHIGRINNLRHGKCPPNIYHDLHNLTGWQKTTKKGLCEFECGYLECLENIMLVINGTNPTTNLTTCHIARLRHLRKPGPVNDLKVINKTSYNITLQWSKPRDRENDYNKYSYTYQWVTESDDKINRTVKTSKTQVLVVLPNLKAGRTYMVTVVAYQGAMHRGFPSQPRFITVTTDERVPDSGPVVPIGSYSIQDSTLGVYWQIMPEEKRGGKIINYNIQVESVDINTTENWTSIDLLETHEDQITVTLTAATKIGYSTGNTTLLISKAMLKQQPVISVHRRDEDLVWNLKDKVLPEKTRAHRCFGKQTKDRQQLVNCKTEIEWVDVSDTGQFRMTWPDPEAPSLSCEQCQWHYAISVIFNNNNTAGMVWNTDPTTDDINLVAIVSLTLLFLAAACVIVYKLIRHNLTCKNYIITLPKAWDTMEDSQPEPGGLGNQVSTSAWKKHQETFFRDSGHESMESDVSKRHSERGLPCQDEQLPLLNVSGEIHDAVDGFICSGSGTEEIELEEEEKDLEEEEKDEEELETSVIGSQEDDFGDWFDDDCDGSGVSDYRLQMAFGADVIEDVSDHMVLWGDNEDLENGNEDSFSKLVHDVKIQDHSELSSASSQFVALATCYSDESLSTSNPQATSYSKVSLPFLNIQQKSQSMSNPSVTHYKETFPSQEADENCQLKGSVKETSRCSTGSSAKPFSRRVSSPLV